MNFPGLNAYQHAIIDKEIMIIIIKISLQEAPMFVNRVSELDLLEKRCAALCSRSGFTPHLIESAKQREDIMLLGLPEIMD